MLHGQAEPFGSGLQEIAIAGGALGIQFEILDASVLENDQLDVLPADIDDDMRIVVVLECRLRMRHGFHQCDVGFQDISQDVLGVTRRTDTKDVQAGALGPHLTFQVIEHVNGVLNRVAIG